MIDPNDPPPAAGPGYLSRNRLIISRAAVDLFMPFANAHPSNSPIILFDNRTPTTLLAASRFDGRPRPRLSAGDWLRFATAQSRQKSLNRFGASSVQRTVC
jgi:hypothetical protein